MPEWSIMKRDSVRVALNGFHVSFRERFRDVMDSLEYNPRPPEAITEDFMGETYYMIAVDVTPPHFLVYRINDNEKKVGILDIAPNKFNK